MNRGKYCSAQTEKNYTNSNMPQFLAEPKTPLPSNDVTARSPLDLERFWIHSSDRFEIRDYEPKDYNEVINMFSAGMKLHGSTYGEMDFGIIDNGKRIVLSAEEHARGCDNFTNVSTAGDLSQIDTYWGHPRCFFLVAVEKSTGAVAGCVGVQTLANYNDCYASALARKLDSFNIASDMDLFAEKYASEDESPESFIQRAKNRLLQNENKCDALYREAELRRMSVKGCYQGTGLAQMILQRAMERAYEVGYSAIHLTTSCTMRSAMKFYKKCKFDYIYISIDHTPINSKVPIGHFRWPITEQAAKIKAFEDAPQMEILREF